MITAITYIYFLSLYYDFDERLELKWAFDNPTCPQRIALLKQGLSNA